MRLSRILIYLTLVAFGFLMVFPFLWSLLSSFKTPGEILTLEPQLWPERPVLDNYREVLTSGSFGLWYLNSLVVAGVVTVSVCFFSSLAGYALAKYRYAGRKFIFITILSTMMIPMEMLIIPWFQAANTLHLTDTYLGIMFPGLISAFGVFMVKQFMESVPDALIESARIDRCSEFKIFWRIVLPMLKPALASLAIFTFIGNWDAFLWPLIVTNDSSLFTLPIGLQSFAGGQGIQYHLVVAAANLVVIPVILVFLVMQRNIIKGIALTGMKG